MRERWHLLIPACGLLFQASVVASMHLAARAVYAKPPYSGESWEWTATVVGLAACAVVSLLLGCAGVYGLLTRSRPVVAMALIVSCCVPALIGGALCAYALFVFLTLV
jgi:hypothetical protein